MLREQYVIEQVMFYNSARAHEVWGLPQPPDIVTFAKKMLTAGYFSTHDMRPKEAYRIFNTWMGDPVRLEMLKAVSQEVRSRGLLTSCRESGAILLDGLKQLEARYPSLVHSARGQGPFCAIDCHTAEQRGAIISTLHNKGFNVGGSGELAIRFRPSLIFQPHHASLFLDAMDSTLTELSR
jgi:4-aminobutyrate aminotransferase/(S)-3-amino-2-methylpropionate transaminase